jgi:hypothetical protein
MKPLSLLGILGVVIGMTFAIDLPAIEPDDTNRIGQGIVNLKTSFSSYCISREFIKLPKVEPYYFSNTIQKN